MSASLLLLGRMLVVAGIVVAVSAVVARAGPFLGAMVAVLPVSAGPAYVFLAMDHDPAFVAGSAVTSLLGVGAAGPFVLAHGWTARRFGTLPSAAAGLGAWLATLAVADAVGLGSAVLPALLAATVLLAAAVGGTRRARREAPPIRAPGRPLDLLVRAASVMAVVAAVTLLATAFGSRAAGFAALMPVVFVSLVLVLQPRVGGPAMAGLLSHAVTGLVSYVPALAAISLLAPRLGSAAALAVALAVILALNGALVLVRLSR